VRPYPTGKLIHATTPPPPPVSPCLVRQRGISGPTRKVSSASHNPHFKRLNGSKAFFLVLSKYNEPFSLAQE